MQSFSDQAKAVEVIHGEVAAFMSRIAKADGIREEDVVDLENRIRSKLTGGHAK